MDHFDGFSGRRAQGQFVIIHIGFKSPFVDIATSLCVTIQLHQVGARICPKTPQPWPLDGPVAQVNVSM